MSDTFLYYVTRVIEKEIYFVVYTCVQDLVDTI